MKNNLFAIALGATNPLNLVRDLLVNLRKYIIQPLTIAILLPANIALSQTILEPNANAVIRDSLCVGDGCLDAQGFIDGFASALLLRDTRTRIDFEDTSLDDANNFPRNDWSILINDTDANGESYFAI